MFPPFEDTDVQLAKGEQLEVFIEPDGKDYRLTARVRDARGRRTIRSEKLDLPAGAAVLEHAIREARSLARKHAGVVIHPDGRREAVR